MRGRICERLGKPFKTTALIFDSREECIEWIIANQLGRRNLTDEQKSYLRGKRYQAEKRTDGGHGDQKSGDHSDTPIPTAAKLAEEYGVSVPTIKRDQDFAEAVDAIAEAQRRESEFAAEVEKMKAEQPKGGRVAQFPKPGKTISSVSEYRVTVYPTPFSTATQ